MRPATRYALHSSLAVVAAVAVLGSTPARALAQLGCQQELKMPEPGGWAEYEGNLDGEHAILRYARLPQDSATTGDLAWIEMSINKGKKAKDAQIYQMLVSTFPVTLEQVQEVIFKAGASKATKVGPIMMRMVRSGLEKSGGLKFTDVCNEVTLVGNETVTVPAGTLPTRHYTNSTKVLREEQKFDTWVAGGVPFGLVQTKGWRYEMTLKQFGKDAKPSITETPQEAP